MKPFYKRKQSVVVFFHHDAVAFGRRFRKKVECQMSASDPAAKGGVPEIHVGKQEVTWLRFEGVTGELRTGEPDLSHVFEVFMKRRQV